MVEPSVPSEPSGGDHRPTAKPDAAPGMFDDPAPTPGRPGLLSWLPSLKVIGLIPVALIAFLLIYYIGGMIWITKVDDDIEFGQTSTAPEGGSITVALVADLIEREVDQHGWVGNDPFFMPGYLLDNMPNFQQGMVTAASRFAIELRDQIARTRGSSPVDQNVEKAGGYLVYPGDVWIFNPQESWAPTASSEKQYRLGIKALRDYNQDVTDGKAIFAPRADNLLTTIDRITADIGSASAGISKHIRDNATSWLDFQADDVFYANKGRLYAYFLVMRALQEDFASVIAEKGVGNAWRQTMLSLEEAATLQPWVITNGSPDSQLRPSHLAAQGFYLLRARTQLKEISNILLK